MTRITADNWGEFFDESPTVYINGIKADDAIEADEAEGTATVLERDLNGRPVIKGDKFVMRKITGRVSFEGKRRELK